MKRLLTTFLVAGLMITAAMSLSSCAKTESDQDIPVDEVIITNRVSITCPICGFVVYPNEPVHTHEYTAPESCPLGPWNPSTLMGCIWYDKPHHIHRYSIVGNGNVIIENEHLGGGSGK